MELLEVINTDVLVIGGGGAGLCAAISSRKEGAEVLLISKSRPGRANNTAISDGSFSASTGERDTPEQHLTDTLVAGRWINRPEMVGTMTLGAQAQVKNLLSYGVPLQKKDNGKLRIVSLPGHSVARNVVTEKSFGTDFTFPLFNFAKDLGVNFIAGVFVVHLCRNEHSDIAGALVIDPARQGLILIQSKATVLATGGAGQIYSQTNNAPGTTGDGYALAFRSGVPLIDMEFVQYYPTFMLEPSLAKTMVIYEILVYRGGARLLNNRGENIALRHGLKDPSAMTRDALALAIAKEIKEGRGINGGVWMDLSTIPEDKIERFQKFIPRGLKRRKLFLVAPVAHFFMGGILVNERGETGIEGLYSAGEVNGGVHGANRLGGNALTEAWVYGDITGRLAAQYALCKKKFFSIENLQSKIKDLKSHTEGKRELSVEEVCSKLKCLMWKKAGIIRTHEELSGLVSDIEKLKEKLSETRASDYKELINKLETGNMLLVGKAVALSALLRKESRGAHYREDFPDEGGEQWVKNTCIKGNEGSEMCATINPKK
ncbi:FAD-binding protein [Pelotomaculum isophthalicicum JI]|uniref:FAD-binding protein n=1 Tax=Pelotomaculum isophthalicicum JI TaxID=947010 RepID=A0A9X4H2M5_9FIRM|nr:FAD-binding protein [Pelotomaculum isophthalicicum]MDF9408506.1 FAD-binding protein [Pelotomaculum isophthalicicum JI]